MSDKELAPDEKGLPSIHAPTFDSNGDPVGQWREGENFWTRNGLNLASFKRRPESDKIVELDKSMKTRHLHMIAIGGSIGAGFFVGSGSALSRGVSISCEHKRHACVLTGNRALDLYSSILLSWV